MHGHRQKSRYLLYSDSPFTYYTIQFIFNFNSTSFAMVARTGEYEKIHELLYRAIIFSNLELYREFWLMQFTDIFFWELITTEFHELMSCHVLSWHVMSCRVVSRRVKSCHVLKCHVMSCHVMSCHVMSWNVMSCHVMSCHVMSCHVMSCHVMSCHVMSCHVMSCLSCHVMSCHVMSCHVMSCHVMSCHVMSCHVMPCHVMSCHVMSCPVMSRHVTSRHVTSHHATARHVTSRHVTSLQSLSPVRLFAFLQLFFSFPRQLQRDAHVHHSSHTSVTEATFKPEHSLRSQRVQDGRKPGQSGQDVDVLERRRLHRRKHFPKNLKLERVTFHKLNTASKRTTSRTFSSARSARPWLTSTGLENSSTRSNINNAAWRQCTSSTISFESHWFVRLLTILNFTGATS